MSLCEYGCGREATHQFKNGKWCCSKSYMSCSGIINPMNFGNSRKNHKKAMENLYKEGSEALIKRRIVMNSSAYKNKQSQISKLLWKDPTFREKQKPYQREKQKLMKKLWKDPDYRKRHTKWLKEGRDKLESEGYYDILKDEMIKGRATYMNSLVTNPSKPQIRLYNLCQEITPGAILNYPCFFTNKSIDIAIPHLAIAIEYDGSYWHQNNEEDKSRQKLLEEQGWKFIRYIDRIPSKEELLKDINEVLKK